MRASEVQITLHRATFSLTTFPVLNYLTIQEQCRAVKVAFEENNKQANFSLGTKRGSKLFYHKCFNIFRLQLILVGIVGLVTVREEAPFVFFLIEGEKRSLCLKRVKALKSHSPNFWAS